MGRLLVVRPLALDQRNRAREHRAIAGAQFSGKGSMRAHEYRIAGSVRQTGNVERFSSRLEQRQRFFAELDYHGCQFDRRDRGRKLAFEGLAPHRR